MNIRRNATGLMGVIATGIALVAGGASAQDYPNKEIEWIIPFSAGSGADTFARTLIAATEDVLGVPIVPTNRAGGGTAIGVAAAATQPADGYTLFSQSDTLALGLSTGDWPVTVDDVQAVARINADYKTLMVPAGSQFETFEDFVSYAQENPGAIRMGGVGSRSWSSAFVNKLSNAADIEVTYVPYDGGSNVVSAILGENIDAAVITSSNINAQVDAGEIRILGQSLGERVPERPDVPTFKEMGLTSIDDDVLWRGVFAPAGVPEEILATLSAAFEEAIKDPRWREYMAKQKQQDAYMAYEEFDEFFRNRVAELSE
ncbi:tripartite tricarboxylate transporter substrate binding protein [Salibaculum sp.]|uniref:Bug family tripartite tricarboxylate transporter substrate binding protein n=1 Tax=Salibaculum sp. TaxID=2855480 RepID=UPI002B460882|nr:tripartite tricarboxylate transporter substrate binding protein [Salibaculum sp.]